MRIPAISAKLSQIHLVSVANVCRTLIVISLLRLLEGGTPISILGQRTGVLRHRTLQLLADVSGLDGVMSCRTAGAT